MVLFCDTSVLPKLYIIEAGSEVMRERVAEADAVAVCRIALSEAFLPYLAGRARCRGRNGD